MLENFLIMVVILLYTIVIYHFGAFYSIFKLVSHPDRREINKRLDELREQLEDIKGDF